MQFFTPREEQQQTATIMTKERSSMLQSLSCPCFEEEMARWKAVPKIELHAHLNGCIRPSTLLELASQQVTSASIGDIGHIICEANQTLSGCFKLFPLIHGLTTDHSVVTRITKEAIEDFVADNVVYLELRTTPKSNEAHGMTKRSYVEAVLAGFEVAGVSPCLTTGTKDPRPNTNSHKLQRSEIQDKASAHVRLLLSIDRQESAQAAMDTVDTYHWPSNFLFSNINENAGRSYLRGNNLRRSIWQVLLAWEMRNRGVLGIDLSGNPAIGHLQTFLPALNWAKQHGMPLTLHCGEVFNPEEVREMLTLEPQRLGHVCCVDEPEWSALLESNIPVEICLSSNVKSRSVRSIFDHHFAALHKAKHPTILCTDDPGLFSTCLSHEYSLATTCFGLSEADILIMGKNAVEYTFAAEHLKLTLRDIFAKALTKMTNKHEEIGI